MAFVSPISSSFATVSRSAFCAGRQMSAAVASKRSIHATPLKMNGAPYFVPFDIIAREWRCKWSKDDNHKSLEHAQKLLEEYLPQLKKMDGVVKVTRTVCGGCLDWRTVVHVKKDAYGAWEKASHAPEAEYLKKLGAIKGITNIETQTYTIMDM